MWPLTCDHCKRLITVITLSSFHSYGSVCSLIGSRVMEPAAYCNQIMLVPFYTNSTQKASVNWIIRLLLSLLYWPKVILLSGGHCSCFESFLSCFTSQQKCVDVQFWSLGGIGKWKRRRLLPTRRWSKNSSRSAGKTYT